MLEYTELRDGRLVGTGMAADAGLRPGDERDRPPLASDGKGVALVNGGKIEVDAEGRTSMAGVWAGGDCATGGDDLTVTAVAEGRDAAESIHRYLTGN